MREPSNGARGAAAPFPCPPAGLPRRLAALAYDGLLLAALAFVLTLLGVLARGGHAIDAGTWWFELLLLGAAAWFCAWFWTHGGQTLGMRAWRIRVVRENGTALDWRSALGRWAAAWLAALPLELGYWWSLIDRERRCWHDHLSGTRVIVFSRARPRSAHAREADRRDEQ